MRRLALFPCALVLTVTACAGGSDASSTVRVFAASSMTDVLPDISAEFERTSTVQVELNFGGSSALREQILDGADADVFISANEDVMLDILNSGITTSGPSAFAETSMTIAVPVGNPGAIRGLEAFADQGLTLGLCSSEVPCGQLADEVLAAQDVVAAVDTREPNVRALLSKVELGELDGALVYRTDVLASDQVQEIELVDGAGGRAVYLALSLDDDSSRDERFVEFLQLSAALELLGDAGFEIP